MTKGGPSALGNNAKRSNILKFSRLSENPATLRSKGVEFPLSSTDNNERTSPRTLESNRDGMVEGVSTADGRMLKFARYSGSCISSPRSKRLEINNGAIQPSANLPEHHPFSPKARKSSALRKDLLLGKPALPLGPSKSRKKRKNSTVERSQMDKCAEVRGQVRRLPSDVDEGYDQMQDSAEILELCSVNQNNIHTTHKLNHLENVLESDIEAGTNEESHERSKLIESEQESEDVSTSDQEETVISKDLHSAAEYCSPDMATVCSEDGGSFHQHYKSEDEESAAEEVTEKAVGGMIGTSGETRSSDGDALAPHADLQLPCLEGGHVGAAWQPILQVLRATPRAFDDQGLNCVGEEGNREGRAIIEGRASAFIETDPTVIQRLGASFPSLGEMGNEVQENSSITSSGPHFIRNQHQQVDGDQSGSPSSANSAFSPPPMKTSDFKYMGQQSSLVGPFEIQEKLSLSFSDSNGEATLLDAADFVMNCTLPSASLAEGAEKEKMDHENMKVATTKKGPMKFSDHQPCCCSLKEGLSRGAALSYQESQLQGRKGLVPTNRRQVTTSNPNFRPEIFTSFSTCWGSGVGSNSMKASSNAGMKLQTSRDFGLSSPSSQTLPSPSSTSSPTLRLMGKDVMIMRKDEDESMSLQKVPLAPLGDPPNPKYLTLLGFSTGNVSNQDSFSFHRRSPDDPFLFGLDHPCYPQNFDVGISGAVRFFDDYKVVHQTPLKPHVSHQEPCPTGFMGSPMQQGSKDVANTRPQQKTLNRKPNPPLSHHVEGPAAARRQHLKPVSVAESANSMREVIVIDDTPEVEPELNSIDANYSVGSRRNQSLHMDISHSLPPSNSYSRTTKGFTCFPLPSTFTDELSGGPKPDFLMSCPGANPSSSKGGGNAVEGPRFLSPSSSTLASPSTGFLNPMLYYSSSSLR